MGDEELLNSPPRELQKSNLNNIRINPEQQNQEALNIPLINVEVQSTESKSISERNLSADNENFDGGKKEIVKARTEGKPSVDTKKKPKRLFSFEALVRAMYCGEVSALLAEHSLQGVPHRGISVERLCVPLIALIGNKMIKSGKVVDREMVELPTGRRILASVGKIKAYETRLHDRLVTTLTSKTWESIELNSFTEGQQPLFNNVSTKVLTINLRSSCINMRFVACKSAEFLWWNSMPAGREMLKHFPALKGVAYSD
uniref:Uncharacterized protein n=1 Tax=Strongyloides papillosus TaxID=174720 RepID=A0A0N5BUU2_STREA